MFRFWAGATAGFLVGSLGVSGVFAEGLGSTIAPPTSSPPNSAYFFADASDSFHYRAANAWDRTSGLGLAKASTSTSATETFAFAQMVSTVTGGGGWPSLTIVPNATSNGEPRISDSKTNLNSYFTAFQSLSKNELNGANSSGTFAVPVGLSTDQPMR
jgi:hypothetical protein